MDAFLPILVTLVAAALSAGCYCLGYSRGAAIARLPPLDREPISTKRPVGPRRELY